MNDCPNEPTFDKNALSESELAFAMELSDCPVEGHSLRISITGLIENPATTVCDYIGNIIRRMARHLHLNSLEAITITHTYAQTLAEFDRGFSIPEVLAPTSESFASGMAMVVPVKRGDEFKCHLLIDTGLAAAMIYAPEEDMRVTSFGMLIHELGHVHDLGMHYTMFRDQILCPPSDALENWLQRVTGSTWSEYYACFVAAPVDDNALNGFIETFLNALAVFPNEIRNRIIEYRVDGDLDTLMAFISNRCQLLFKFAGYVIGHLRGAGLSLQDVRPEAWQRITASEFAETWSSLQNALDLMLETYPNWDALSAYDALKNTLVSYLESQGVYLTAVDINFRVNIPFTPETMSSGPIA